MTGLKLENLYLLHKLLLTQSYILKSITKYFSSTLKVHLEIKN